MTLAEFRSALRRLSALELAALLSELAVELYHRNVPRWRVLAELRDEVVDLDTFRVTRTLVHRWTRLPRFKPRARRRRVR